MPLDPKVRLFLDLRKSMGSPGFHQLSPEEARKVAVAEADMLPGPEPLAETRDLKIPGPGGHVPARAYVPEAAGPLGVFVYFHGGGWVVGDVATHDGIASALARAAGCVVLSVDYRLAPEHKYPAAADDAYAATAWAFEHAASIHGDSARIAVGGDSAGGNLAAVVSLMGRDRGAFRPVLQVIVYPITDYRFDTPSYRENADGYGLTLSDMKWFWENYLAREADGTDAYASPLRAGDLRGLAPALVLTAEYDPLRDEGEAYARRLEEAGVPVTLTRYDGMIHGFFRRTHLFDQARAAVQEVADGLRKAFASG